MEVRSQKPEVRRQCLLFVFAIVIGVFVPAIAGAQMGPQPTAKAQPAASPVKPNEAQVTVVPAMKTEDQLRVRDLQYAQDKALLEIRQIEARFKELQASVRALNQQIDDAVRAAGVDPTKFVFDLDELKFVPRPAPAVNQPAKPLEVKKQ